MSCRSWLILACSYAVGVLCAALLLIFLIEIGVLANDMLYWIPKEVLWIELGKLILVFALSERLFTRTIQQPTAMFGIGVFFGLSWPLGALMAIPIDMVSNAIELTMHADFRLLLIIVAFAAIQIALVRAVLTRARGI